MDLLQCEKVSNASGTTGNAKDKCSHHLSQKSVNDTKKSHFRDETESCHTVLARP